MSETSGPITVDLPEPIGRRARLGPFPSGTDALKFASYAGVGAVVASATDPLLWLPFLGAGLVAAAVPIDGKGFDARLLDYARFRWRAGGRRRAPGWPPVRGAIARGPGGRWVALLETDGVPVAFLPRAEARTLFDAFRVLLRAPSEGLCLFAFTRPVDVDPLRPPAEDGAAPAPDARSGYTEMLGLLARRRRRRVVLAAVWSSGESPETLRRLEERVEACTGGLIALGLTPVRLRDAALGRALASIGWRARS